MQKKRYLKKWCDKLLILINVLIFVILTSLNIIDDILNIILLVVIFSINAMILKKYSKILKEV